MITILSLAALLVPQQQAPSAADFMPDDTFLYLEMSMEPFHRLGDQTIAYKMFEKGDVAEALTPLADEVHSHLDALSMELGFDVVSLVAGSRFSIGLNWTAAINEGGWLPVAAELTPAVAENVRLDAILNEAGIGNWWQGGNLLIGVLHTDEFGRLEGNYGPAPNSPEANALRADGAKYLQAMLDRTAYQRTGGMTGLDSWKAMTSKCRGKNDVTGAWLMMDKFSREMFEDIIGEEMPDEIVQMMEILEIDKFRGVGWTTSVAPPMLEDRIMIYGPGMMQKYFPANVNEAANVPMLMGLLPHDSYQTMMFVADYGKFGEDIKACIDLMLQLGDEEMPEEAAGIMDMVFALLAETGPVFLSNARADDYERGLPGDFWLQARNPEKVTEILQAGLPDGLADALAEGMMFGPGVPEVLLTVRGNRLTVFESMGPETNEVLATQPEFRGAAALFAKYPVTEVYGAEYLSAAMMSEAFEILRSDGNALLHELAGDDLPLDLGMLPAPAVVSALMQSSATVSVVTPEGFYSEGHAPFGRLATHMLIRIPAALKMLETFGMLSTGEFEAEEF